MVDRKSSPKVEYGAEIEIVSRVGELSLQYVDSPDAEGVIVHSKGFRPSGEASTIVRIHSSCMFSESLSAVDCDCAAQLDAALEIIATEGGYLLYFFEEGRGAGLRLKFEAIHVEQEEDCDTVEAYAKLGLSSDLRKYDAAATILKKLLKGSPVELLTNNLRKVWELEKRGINVARRRPLVVVKTARVRDYLFEKVRILGHVVDAEELRDVD